MKRSAAARTFAAVVAVAAGLTAAAAAAQTPARVREFVQEDSLVTVTLGGGPVRLEVLTVRSADRTGRLPIALITHGKPASDDDLATVHASNFRSIARDLARRGWLAVAVVRRGFGLSEGEQAYSGTCRPGADLAAMFRREAEDLAAVLTEIGRKPFADPARAIALGGSAGGAAVLALASQPPPGLKAVVNVSGGLRLNACPFEDRLVAAIAGLRPKVPALWVYARNDKTFPAELVARMHAAAVAAGSDARMTMLDPVGEDGHVIFMSTEGRVRWYAALDAFLVDLGLPTIGPAEVDTLMAAGLEPGQRTAAQRYLSVPGEKALARPAGGGRLNWSMSGSDVTQARKSALEQCEKSGTKCEILAENNRLVPPSPAVPPAAAGAPGREAAQGAR